MIEAWRFAKQPYANDLSGEGAKRAGGRWNSRGFPVVYLAEHPALALVEIRAHLAVPYDDLPDDYMLLRVALPDEPPERILTMPSNPQAIGDEWLLSGRTAVLRVPSVIVPQATNLLLNPKHSLAASASIISAKPFKFDPRLWHNAPSGIPAP